MCVCMCVCVCVCVCVHLFMLALHTLLVITLIYNRAFVGADRVCKSVHNARNEQNERVRDVT